MCDLDDQFVQRTVTDIKRTLGRLAKAHKSGGSGRIDDQSEVRLNLWILMFFSSFLQRIPFGITLVSENTHTDTHTNSYKNDASIIRFFVVVFITAN